MMFRTFFNTYSIFGLFILCLSLYGCKSSKQAVKRQEKNHSKEAVISFYRAPCYGHCPVYSVQFFESGKVVFLGKQHTKTEGEHTFHLTPKETNLLFRDFEVASWSEYKDEYPLLIVDFPSFQLTYSGKDIQKEIRASWEEHVPASLLNRVSSIEELLKTYKILE